jgi:glycerol uptake facilitator-like aquaporin
MEIPNGNKFMIAAVIMEFFGVIGYSLAVNMNNGTNVVALVMFIMIVSTQSISGGHLNPSLTLGVYLERNTYLSYACWAISMVIA